MNNFILISFSVVVFSTLQCLGQVPSIEDVSASNESLNIAVSVNPGMVYQLNLSDDLVAWEPSGQFTTQSTSETVQIPIQEGNEQVFATISELGFESTFSGELLEFNFDGRFGARTSGLGQNTQTGNFYYLAGYQGSSWEDGVLTEATWNILVEIDRSGQEVHVELSQPLPERFGLLPPKKAGDYFYRYTGYNSRDTEVARIGSSGTVDFLNLTPYIDDRWLPDSHNFRAYSDGLVLPLKVSGFSLAPVEFRFLVITNEPEMQPHLVSIKMLQGNGAYFDAKYATHSEKILLSDRYLYIGSTLYNQFGDPSVTESAAVVAKIDVLTNAVEFIDVLDNENDVEDVTRLSFMDSGILISGRQSTRSSTSGKAHRHDPFHARLNNSGTIEWIRFAGFESRSMQFLHDYVNSSAETILIEDSGLVLRISNNSNISMESIANVSVYSRFYPTQEGLWIWDYTEDKVTFLSQ